MYHRGDVYWIYLSTSGRGEHIQEGYRPCVIVSNDRNNCFSPTLNFMPLTTKKDNLSIHKKIRLRGKDNYCMPEQIVTMNKSYAKDRGYIDTLSRAEMRLVDEAIKIQLGLM